MQIHWKCYIWFCYMVDIEKLEDVQWHKLSDEYSTSPTLFVMGHDIYLWTGRKVRKWTASVRILIQDKLFLINSACPTQFWLWNVVYTLTDKKKNLYTDNQCENSKTEGPQRSWQQLLHKTFFWFKHAVPSS